MTNRHNLDLFYQRHEESSSYLNVQEITPEVYSATQLHISNLSMDFPAGTSSLYRKELTNRWTDILPGLDLVKSLSIRSVDNDELFEAICKMGRLEHLHIWSSTVEDISSIANLKGLKSLLLDSFSRLSDISPLLRLKNLLLLSIENSLKIENLDLIGQMTQLKGLRLGGDAFAPRRLRIKSLRPFRILNVLQHLDLSTVLVEDNSYDVILDLKALERFDSTVTIPKAIRHSIKANHKNLKAGFFMDWDFDSKKLYEGKVW